jgi:lipoprotein-anchoring transpeptidase ErfK/SrfK
MQDEDIQGNGHKQSRVHFRPAPRSGDVFWPANVNVRVDADLYGVDYGNSWGREDIVRHFKIGPDLKVQGHVDSHRLLVIKNDEIIKNFPVAYGKESVPGRNTVSGIHVITEKKPGAFTMCNPKYDYCNVKEYWGVRINNNGEFIHANVEVEKQGLLGKANVSHGCINMSMADAKTFFHMVYYGVPVDVQGTGVKMSYADYIWDWSVSYDQWKTFSAL